jgi:hypothetical protein
VQAEAGAETRNTPMAAPAQIALIDVFENIFEPRFN